MPVKKSSSRTSPDTKFKAKLAELSKTFKTMLEIKSSVTCDKAILLHMRLKISNQLSQLVKYNKQEKL